MQSVALSHRHERRLAKTAFATGHLYRADIHRQVGLCRRHATALLDGQPDRNAGVQARPMAASPDIAPPGGTDAPRGVCWLDAPMVACPRWNTILPFVFHDIDPYELATNPSGLTIAWSPSSRALSSDDRVRKINAMRGIISMIPTRQNFKGISIG